MKFRTCVKCGHGEDEHIQHYCLVEECKCNGRRMVVSPSDDALEAAWHLVIRLARHYKPELRKHFGIAPWQLIKKAHELTSRKEAS